ncbi:helix-turn-helix domain-containing protein [Actinomadura sp. 9N215]|uniref:helix-turn-helix domain-containing protein n=1 Tax=Actinomadura sp. 9N215 TaxID=3375150 RepID=UPI0037BB1DBA
MSALSQPSFAEYLRYLRSASPAARASKNGLLSRTNLAARASVSVGYVIKLEQGRAVRPSPDVVDRIAGALEVGAVENRHLHDLANYGHTADDLAAGAATSTLITPVMREVADNLYPHLAAYFDENWNILYANSEFSRIHRGIESTGNVLKWLFFSPESRAVLVDWDAEARLIVAWFRAHMVRRPGNGEFTLLLDDLASSAEFRQMWERQEVCMGRQSLHMLVRDLDFDEQTGLLAQVYSWPPPSDDVQMFLGVNC